MKPASGTRNDLTGNGRGNNSGSGTAGPYSTSNIVDAPLNWPPEFVPKGSMV